MVFCWKPDRCHWNTLSDHLQIEVYCGPQWCVCFALPYLLLCNCGGCGRNRGPWGQLGQSSQIRREQVAIPVTRPFPNISPPSEHGVNTFTAPLGNLRPTAGLCKSLWWQVTLAEGGTVCLGAPPGHTGHMCGQTCNLGIEMLPERNTQTGGVVLVTLYIKDCIIITEISQCRDKNPITCTASQ